MGRDQDVESGAQLWGNDVVPIGQHPSNNIFETLAGGQHIGRQQPVASIVDWVLGARQIYGWRWNVVAAAPEFGLLSAVLLGGGLLVEAL